MRQVAKIKDRFEHPLLVWIFASGVLMLLGAAVADWFGNDWAAGFLAIFAVNMFIFWAFGHFVYLLFRFNNWNYYRSRRSSV